MTPPTFEQFCERVRLVVCLDHSGRAGNGFFQSIFDQHEQVLTCPWIHYVHSYLVTRFGAGMVDSAEAHAYWVGSPYFRSIYDDLDEGMSAFVRKFGGDPEALIDRPALRATFDALILSRATVDARLIVLATYYAYAVGTGRDLSKIEWVLVSDAVSLRTERWWDGFSGRHIEYVIAAYRDPLVLHLERDPRAAFASSNHQFVNQLGNMYAVRWGSAWRQLRRLATMDVGFDAPFVFGCWLVYFTHAYDVVKRLKADHGGKMDEVRNEDLNCDFIRTMTRLCDLMGVSFLDAWRDPDHYVPTMVGKPWTGTGAYNNAYQTHRNGPLANDPDSVARNVTGPNRYVTERWRSRMASNEIELVDYFCAGELADFGYQPYGAPSRMRLLFSGLRPLRGELPSLGWLLRGWRSGGGRELGQRLFYALVLPPFYLLGRLALLRLALGLIPRPRRAAMDSPSRQAPPGLS